MSATSRRQRFIDSHNIHSADISLQGLKALDEADRKYIPQLIELQNKVANLEKENDQYK